MKTLGLTFAAAVLLPLAGCKWLEELRRTDSSSDKTGKGIPPENAQPEKFVAYVNEHAARLQSITFADARVTAQDRSGVVPSPPITLTGDLFASQPRNFNLFARGGLVDAKVILGSNDQQFWVYAKVPTVDPMYYYASHTDFAEGRARMPGNLPFEPEWVMQTLGMITLAPPDNAPGLTPGAPVNHYTLKPDESKRTYTLSWPTVLPGARDATSGGAGPRDSGPPGRPVTKEIVFESERATGNRPQVKRHIVRDAATGKVICYAEIKSVKTVTGVAGPQTGTQVPFDVQYPSRVLLRWEEQKFEMDLEITNAKINQPLSPEEARRRYNRPNIPDVRQINLAGG